MSTFVLLTITGLGLGAMYFLVASGLSLIYGGPGRTVLTEIGEVEIEVPRDRVFIDSNRAVYNTVMNTTWMPNIMHQTMIRARVKLEFAWGLACKMAETINASDPGKQIFPQALWRRKSSKSDRFVPDDSLERLHQKCSRPTRRIKDARFPVKDFRGQNLRENILD